MPTPSISPISLAALLAQETGEVFIMLATLTHPSLPQPIRVCSDITPIISNGVYFFGFRFDIQFPDDKASGLQTAQAMIDNVDPSIGEALETIASASYPGQTGAMYLKVEFVRAALPDLVEITWDFLRMRNVKVDDTSVSGVLTYEDIVNEPIACFVTPSTYPGVFGTTQ